MRALLGCGRTGPIVLRLLPILLLVLFLGACSQSASIDPIEKLSYSEAESPTIELEELANDGRILHVVVNVRGLGQARMSQAVLRLSGYGDGKVVRQRTEPLESVLVHSEQADDTEEGSLRAYLALPVSDLSSYQVELLWGGDALAASSGSVSEGSNKGTLVVRSAHFEGDPPPCQADKCDDARRIRVELYNSGTSAVIEASVSLALRDEAAVGEPLKTPAGRLIRMKPLNIPPGGQQVVRLKVPGSLIEEHQSRSGGPVVPEVKVTEVKFAESPA